MRCNWCAGSGIVAGPNEYETRECMICNGTGVKEEPKMAFKVGDVVMLKSGGPHMTVAETHVTDAVTCLYFQGSPHLIGNQMGMLFQPQRYRETFPVDALKEAVMVVERKPAIVIPQ